MLAKKNKLPTRKLKYTLKKGDLSYSKFFVIRKTDSNEEKKHFTTIVSKKISKKAVTRNKLRRQIFEAIRLNLESAELQQTIFIPKRNISNATFQEIEHDIKQFLNKKTNGQSK